MQKRVLTIKTPQQSNMRKTMIRFQPNKSNDLNVQDDMVLIDDNMTSLLFQNEKQKTSEHTMSTLSKSVVTSRKTYHGAENGKVHGLFNMNIKEYLQRPNINMRNLKS